MNTQQLLKADLLDIIFEGKNKMYGAYLLRKGYANRLLTSLTLSIGATLLVSAILFWWPKKIDSNVLILTNEIDLSKENKKDKIKKEELKIKENKAPKTTQKIATAKQTVPLIVPDNTLIPPPNKSETEKEISNIDNDLPIGNGQLPPLPPTPIGEPGGSGGDKLEGKIIPPTPPNIETPDLSTRTKKPATWDRYLQSALQPYADKAMENGCEEGNYRIVITFLVDEEGKPSEANIIEGGDVCNLGSYAKAILLKGPNWPINRDANGNPTKSIQKTSFVISLGE